MHMVGTDSSVGWGDGYYGRGLTWSEEALGESDIEAEIKGTCELAALGGEEGEDGDQKREQRFQGRGEHSACGGGRVVQDGWNLEWEAHRWAGPLREAL